MKKLFLITLLFLIACSGSKQHQVEKTIKLYLDTVLNDPHGYESIKFDTIHTNYADYSVGDPEGKRLDTLAKKFLALSQKYTDIARDELYSNNKQFDKDFKLSKDYLAKADSIENAISAKGKGYKGGIYSYSITHTYRAKNGFGALTIHKTLFVVDSSISKVTFSKDIK